MILTQMAAFVVVLPPSEVLLLYLTVYFWRWGIHLGNTKVAGIKIEGPLLWTDDTALKCSHVH